MDRSIVVLTPLISLEDCHVATAKKYDLKAVADNPGIIPKAMNGVYQLIFICPEMLKANHPIFQQMSQSKTFQKRLLGFIIDEVHLCYQWFVFFMMLDTRIVLIARRRTFRADYTGLGLPRIYFPHVPFMGLLATVPLYVRGFIHTTLRFPKGCLLIQRPVNRENVFIMIQPIRGNTKSFNELSFLISKHLRNLSGYGENIPKTMLFTDGLKEACKINTALGKMLPKKVYEESPEVVLEYSTGITLEKRAYNLERFIEGTTHIMVCTEACGMGLNVLDIERVIQWRISQRCNLSSLCQRFGRVTRRPDIQGVAILFHTTFAEVTSDHSPEAQIYKYTWDDPRYYLVSQDIVRFDMGLISLTAPRGLKHKGEPLDQPDPKLTRANPGYAVPSIDNMLAIFALQPPKKTAFKTLPLVCQGILSLINTTKCRRQIILKYFAEVETHRSPHLCCDHCSGSQFPSEIRHLIPPADIIKPTNQTARPFSRLTKVSQETQKLLREKLTKVNVQVWKDTGGNKRFIAYPASALLGHEEIDLLVSRATSIKLPEHIYKALNKKPSTYDGQLRQGLFNKLFDEIMTTIHDLDLQTNSTPPTLVTSNPSAILQENNQLLALIP